MVYPNVSDPVSVPEGTPSGTLFVSVDKTYGKGICDPQTGKRVSLMDCARGYWTVANLKAVHADECDWLMARQRGKIVGVWKIDKKKSWMLPSATPKATWPSDKPTDYPRKGCILLDTDDVVEKRFVGKEVRLGRCPNTLRSYFYS